MKVIVGTTAVSIPKGGRGRPIIQNLGPGYLYLDTDAVATASDGLQMSPGDVYEFPDDGGEETTISLIADAANTDVRIVRMGEGSPDN